MLSRRSFRALCLSGAAGLGLCALAAGPSAPSFSRDYVPRLDSVPTSAVGLDGRVWSVWSYRSAGEFDVAIAVREPGSPFGPTAFLGRRDGIDQVDPTIAIDDRGSVYLAFATRNPQRIWTSVLPAGQTTWSTPSPIVVDEAAAAPALRVVRDRLVVAYRTPRGVHVFDLPIYVETNAPDGIQDGPDGVDPLGNGGGTELPGGGGGSDEPPPPPPPTGGEE